MATREGPLVLADISGYTAFVAATELEHSERLVTILLDQIVATFRDRLEMAQLEGDAIFLVGDRSDADIVGWLEDCYIGFHHRLLEVLANTTCGCAACERGPTLTLKLIAHHGVYSRQQIGSTTQVHGVDVIVPHRLAKNRVPSHEYMLLTAAALERIPPEQRAAFTRHVEEVADFGRLELGYRDLGPLRSRVEPPCSDPKACAFEHVPPPPLPHPAA